MKWLALILVVLSLAACGGGGPHTDKVWLQGEIKRQANLNLLGTGRGRVSVVSCVQDGSDGYHFECLASLASGDSISFRATCDTSSYCVWKED